MPPSPPLPVHVHFHDPDWFTDGAARTDLLSVGSESQAKCRAAVHAHTSNLREGQVTLLRRDFRSVEDAAWPQPAAGATLPEAPPPLPLLLRGVAPPPLPSFNVYLFDGPHDEVDHFDALAVMLPRLDATFVLLVDDWNGPEVQKGTLDALAALNLTVVFGEVLGGGLPPGVYGKWHNGFFVAVVQKPAMAQ